VKKWPEIDIEPGRVISYTGCAHEPCEAEHCGFCDFCADHCRSATCPEHGIRCPKCFTAIAGAELHKRYIPDDYFADIACEACGLKCELYTIEREIFIRERTTANRCPQCGSATVYFGGDVLHTWEITGESIVCCMDCEDTFVINQREPEQKGAIEDGKQERGGTL
jgi:hypothetical protein